MADVERELAALAMLSSVELKDAWR